MSEAKTESEVEVTFEWMRVASGVARGLLAPEEGVVMLQALAEAHPADRGWLLEEVETIRFQFGLGVVELVHGAQGSYWDKLLLVVEAVLDECIDHERALELLLLIDSQHPEHTEQTVTLINDIEDSPLRQFLELDD